ncbi:hypothetical protein RCL1_005301 [Eukaryota sp. TZLM3-RCL]
MLNVVQSKKITNKLISIKDSKKRTLFSDVHKIVEGVHLYGEYWTNCRAFCALASPLMSVLRLADLCSAGFGAFAHWTLGIARKLVKENYIKAVSGDIEEPIITQRIIDLDEILLNRAHYAVDEDLFIIRLLNPALRHYNLNFSTIQNV